MLKTLNEFIESQIKEYGLDEKLTPHNKQKLIARIRAKDTAVMKKSGIWNNSVKKTIGKNSTNFFDTKDLEKVSTKTHKYMTKLACKELGKTQKEIEDNREQYWQDIYNEEFLNKTPDELEKEAKEAMGEDFKPDNFKPDNYYDEYAKNEDDFSSNTTQPKRESSEALEKSLDRLMLRALFNKFFSMSEDQLKLYATDLTNTQNKEVQKRLNNPLGTYYNEK